MFPVFILYFYFETGSYQVELDSLLPQCPEKQEQARTTRINIISDLKGPHHFFFSFKVLHIEDLLLLPKLTNTGYYLCWFRNTGQFYCCNATLYFSIWAPLIHPTHRWRTTDAQCRLENGDSVSSMSSNMGCPNPGGQPWTHIHRDKATRSQ